MICSLRPDLVSSSALESPNRTIFDYPATAEIIIPLEKCISTPGIFPLSF